MDIQTALENFSDFLFRRKWRRIREAIQKHKPEEGPDGMSAEAYYDLALRNERYGKPDTQSTVSKDYSLKINGHEIISNSTYGTTGRDE